MRILHIGHRAEPIGGAELWMRALIAGQRRRGHQTLLVAGVLPGAPAELDVFAIERPTFDPARQFEDRAFTDAVTAAAAALRPDVVHLHQSAHLPVALYGVLRALGRPLVQGLYDHALLCTNGWLVRGDGTACAGGPGAQCLAAGCERHQNYDAVQIAAAAWRLREARVALDATVVPTDRMAALAMGHGLPRVRMLPYFTVEPLRTRARHSGANGAAERILCMARLEPEKGVEVLLEAFATLANARPMAVLEIVGAGSRRAALEARIAKLGLARRVVLTGAVPREELGAVLERADVVAVPSIWTETMPLAILDAFAADVPVVASDVGGIGFALEEGTSGLLVPSGDAAALARALGRVLAEPKLAQGLRAGGRASLARFDADAQFAGLEALYAELSSDPATQRTRASSAPFEPAQEWALTRAMAESHAAERAKQLQLLADFECEREWIRATVGYVQRDPLTRAINRLRGGPDLAQFLDDLR